MAMKLVIQRSSSEFVLLQTSSTPANSKYKIVWTEAKLEVERVKTNPESLASVMRTWKSGYPIYLPFSKTDARAFEIPNGSRHYKANSLFSGAVPSRALLVFLPPESLGYGSITNNPLVFNAAKYKINHVQFFVNEKPVLPTPYRPDFDSKEFTTEYAGLLQVLGLDRTKYESMMTYELFGTVYGVFGVGFGEFNEYENATLSLEVQFKEGTTETLSGLLIPEYNACLELDSNGNVSEVEY